jgi:hypothetical protein
MVGGGSTAAAVAVLTRNSAPLTGSVPALAGALRYDIPLIPDLEPGDAGWCSYPLFSITGRIDNTGGGTCSPAVPSGAAVIIGGGEPISNEAALLRSSGSRVPAGSRPLSLVWMVVGAQVAAVRIAPNEVITPRADPRLPQGWRAVVAFSSATPDQLRLVPLDRTGAPIASSIAASGRVSARSGEIAPSQSYVLGSGQPAPCAIGPVRLPDVTAQWETVATKTPALGSTVSQGTLFSCARSWFSIKGQPEAASAAFVLNAQDPGRLAPAPPGLKPSGEPGLFSEPAAEIVAKRVGLGWLIVQSRSSAESTMLLGALRVGGSAPGVVASGRSSSQAASAGLASNSPGASNRLPSMFCGHTRFDGRSQAVRPGEIMCLSADGSTFLAGAAPRSRQKPVKQPPGAITWARWTDRQAIGRGYLWENTCRPECSIGNYAAYPASIRASGVRHGQFTRLVITAIGLPRPSDTATLTYDLDLRIHQWLGTETRGHAPPPLV